MERHTDNEDPMIVLHEMKLMEKIIFTDTVDDHDTLSISPSLVEDSNSFINIGQQIVGNNFLKTPY
jgi:hypothetical protein